MLFTINGVQLHYYKKNTKNAIPYDQNNIFDYQTVNLWDIFEFTIDQYKLVCGLSNKIPRSFI